MVEWTAICTKCGEEKPLSEFQKRNSAKGIHSWCKKCVSVYSTAYNKAHPEKRRAQYRRWVNTAEGRAYKMHSCKAAWCKKHNVEYDLSKDWYLTRLEGG